MSRIRHRVGHGNSRWISPLRTEEKDLEHFWLRLTPALCGLGKPYPYSLSGVEAAGLHGVRLGEVGCIFLPSP
jgi:hypothetical protein